MISDQVKVSVFFPKIAKPLADKGAFLELILEDMKKEGALNSTGYSDISTFKSDLLHYMGKSDPSSYMPLVFTAEENIKGRILMAVERCHQILPHPDLPIFINIYPWFPDEGEQQQFGGVMAFSSYYTTHILVNVNSLPGQSLEYTVAHEWNHLVFYRFHTENEYSLKTYLVMEGLAEVFREEVYGGEPSPWSLAFKDKDFLSQLTQLHDVLDEKGGDIYASVFRGGNQYTKWLGYSIGYILANRFRANNKGLSWTDLVSEEVNTFFAEIKIRK